MSVLPDFIYVRPDTIAEAVDRMSFDDVAFAGGTELLLAMKAGLMRPNSLVDVKRISALNSIEKDNGSHLIGGAVTHQSAIDDPSLQIDQPGMVRVLSHVGNPRVRASGTLGGNLCFAEPKSDVATILIALEGVVELTGRNGTRFRAVNDFILGPYTTSREPDELLVRIIVPSRDGRPSSYVKYQTMERPTVGVAAAFTSTNTCRIVVGAVGGLPEIFEADSFEEFDPAEIGRQVEVIPDLTGSPEYKRHIVSLFVEKAIGAIEDQT